MTLDEWIKDASARLRQIGADGPRLEAQMLAAHALGQARSWVIAHPDAEVPGGVDALLDRRLGREPLAYILGRREFFGHEFLVRPGVLIPRQETETLVDAALALPWETMLDVGTGSGCLAISLALGRPTATVSACDISGDALAIAAENADRLGASVEFAESDLLAAFEGRQFDLIVSNPPYIGRTEELEPEVKDWEPDEALFGGREGTEIYHRLAKEAAPFLKKTGRFVLEVGDGMEGDIRDIFLPNGWSIDGFREDLMGRPRAAILLPPPR